MRLPVTRASALVTLVAFGGCSFFNVKGPGDVTDPPRTYPACTEDSPYPYADAIIGALWMFGAIFAVKENSGDRAQASTIFIMPIAFGVSSAFGFTRTSACVDARTSWRKAYPTMPNGPMPQPYGYPPGPGYPPPQGYPPPGYQQPPPQQPPPGYEGAACATIGSPCIAGLTCASGICVRPPPPPGPQAGTEGGSCTTNNTCMFGLTCASGLCVRPPTPPTPQPPPPRS